MPSSVVPFAVQSGEGKAMLTPTGDTVVVKANTASTNGSISVMELTVAPKSGPAAHSHLREDELWYVVEGKFRFKAAGKMLQVSTGGLAFGPRCMPHAFQNIGDAPGKLLIITAPSGLERFFEQCAEVPPEQLGPADLAAVGLANWIEFAGPPLALSDPI
jgi:mannose-6-phosphate isomerase-like protein (cupin superfamily)